MMRIPVRPRIMVDVLEILQGVEIDGVDPIVVIMIILEGVVEVEGIINGGAEAETVIEDINYWANNQVVG